MVTGNFVSNMIPYTTTINQTGEGSGTKKEDVEIFMAEFKDVMMGNNTKIEKATLNEAAKNVIEVVFDSGGVKNDVDFSKLSEYVPSKKGVASDHAVSVSDTLEMAIETDKKVNAASVSQQSKSFWCTDDTMQSVPWQQLLTTPPQQVIVVERMHSGARRYVTLDFGQPVLLTDVLIPFCHDLVFLNIDLWLKGEDVDGMRLVVASDIGSRNLVLSDLQPPPLCRYMKVSDWCVAINASNLTYLFQITAVGRYGMSTSRCRIPTGCFYGHLVVLPEDVPPEQTVDLHHYITTDLDRHLAVLSKLHEDVGCRYSLACSKLKDLLRPHLMSDTPNACHLSAYMNIVQGKFLLDGDTAKVYSAYQEAVTYQRQLNIVRSVMSRIESGQRSSKG